MEVMEVMAGRKETPLTMDITMFLTDFKIHVQEIVEQLKIVLIFHVQDMEPGLDSDIQFQEMQTLVKTMASLQKDKLVKDSDHVLLQTAELLQDKCLRLQCRLL